MEDFSTELLKVASFAVMLVGVFFILKQKKK